MFMKALLCFLIRSESSASRQIGIIEGSKNQIRVQDCVSWTCFLFTRSPEQLGTSIKCDHDIRLPHDAVASTGKYASIKNLPGFVRLIFSGLVLA
jgi:hypothetical protein